MWISADGFLKSNSGFYSTLFPSSHIPSPVTPQMPSAASPLPRVKNLAELEARVKATLRWPKGHALEGVDVTLADIIQLLNSRGLKIEGHESHNPVCPNYFPFLRHRPKA